MIIPFMFVLCCPAECPSLPWLWLAFFKGKCLCLHSCQSKTFAVKLLLRSQWRGVHAPRLPLQGILASALQDGLESWVFCRGLLLVCDFAIYHNPETQPWTQSALEICSFGNEVTEELLEDALRASCKMLISEFNYFFKII